MTDLELPAYDATVIAELLGATGNDAAFIRELVGTYLAEGDVLLARMAAAAEAGDSAAMVPAAHTLKSSSAALGATRLAAICRGIEEAGRAGRTEEFAREAQGARDAWAETVAALRSAGWAQ